MKSVFINDAFEKAIADYLKSINDVDGKVYNSFLVVVIRILSCIYGELDIINPYYTKNITALNENLTKYGAPQDLIDNFMFMLDMFQKIDERNKNNVVKEENTYFIEVQKKLVDMFILKKNNFGLTDSDSKDFFELLYTPATKNPLRLSYNYLNASDIYEVAKYYQTKMNEVESTHKIEQKDILNLDVYKMFNYKVSDISLMNNDQIKELNSQIYSSLNINENAINKDYLLDQAVKNILHEEQKVTTGNGYVDILIIMSVIITAIMVLVVFTCLVF